MDVLRCMFLLCDGLLTFDFVPLMFLLGAWPFVVPILALIQRLAFLLVSSVWPFGGLECPKIYLPTCLPLLLTSWYLL